MTSDNDADAAKTAVRPRSKPEADDPQSKLVNAIQRELHRVGCYAGDANGLWTEQTKVAMKAFNDSVHVSLGTDQPDYILLTLLQGHSGKACSRSCGGVLNAGAQCIDRTIEARRVPPATLVTRQAASHRGGQAATSSATTSVPVAPTWSTATARTAQLAPIAPERSDASQQVAATSERLKDTPEPLPGRMAMGARSAAVPEAAEPAAAAPAVAPVSEAAPKTVRTQPAPVARPAIAASSSKRRMSRTFIDLSRNSP